MLSALVFVLVSISLIIEITLLLIHSPIITTTDNRIALIALGVLLLLFGFKLSGLHALVKGAHVAGLH